MNEHEWEDVGPVQHGGGFATVVHRMKVPGGYLYHCAVMHSGWFRRTKVHTSMAFVPTPPAHPISSN